MAEQAENAIAGWATNGEAGLSEYFSPDMLANVPDGAMDDTWRQLLEQFGAPTAVTTPTPSPIALRRFA